MRRALLVAGGLMLLLPTVRGDTDSRKAADEIKIDVTGTELGAHGQRGRTAVSTDWPVCCHGHEGEIKQVVP